MVSKVPQLGGLDYDFVEEPPDSLKCLICMMVVNEPWQHGECGRVYCKACLDEYKKVMDTCPNCRKKTPFLFRDGRSEKDVRALMVRCSNSHQREEDDEEKEKEEEGEVVVVEATCKWTGELGDLVTHHKVCPLQLLPCPNNCTENGEEVKVVRRDLEKHLRSECLNRSYTCPHCQETGTYLERATVHLETCSKLDVPCRNKPCNTLVPRNELTRHISTNCLHATIACSHHDIGCSVIAQRKDMKEHESDLTVHMEAARTKIASLEREIRKLKESIVRKEQNLKREMTLAVTREKMTRRGGQKTFRMPNFSIHKNEFKSESFYTAPRGYKMCVIIEENVMSKGSYLAIYAHLMRGEYDDHLPWPLVGTVTFELLNQLGNHRHKKSSCTFPPNDKDNRRVVDKELADAGYGCPKFISHSKLMEVSREVWYIKDDSLYWRVTVEAPDPMDYHWLRCI